MRPQIGYMIRSTLAYFYVAVFLLLLAPASLLWCILTGNSSLLYRLGRFCIRTAGWMCGVRVEMRGWEKAAAVRTCIFLSNHQSNLDGPVLVHAIPRDWKALIKKEMMRMPVFSLVMKQIQFVPLERSNPKQAHAGIELGAKMLAEGNSFIAFPEGTRSIDGQLGEFKKGAFIMALKAQMPVIPVTILDADKILPRGKYAIRPGRIRVIFHDPIATEGMSVENRNQLMQSTRAAIASALPAPMVS
jgi:1-acyl-sn-glycerol-3-phosphate acyltransferase